MTWSHLSAGEHIPPIEPQNLLHKRAPFLEWSISDALLIDRKDACTHSPPSYEKVKHQIGNRLKKLQLPAEPLASQACCIARPDPRTLD